MEVERNLFILNHQFQCNFRCMEYNYFSSNQGWIEFSYPSNLIYVEELSLKEIAYIFDISVPRVSQIHGKMILKLKNHCKNSGFLMRIISA